MGGVRGNTVDTALSRRSGRACPGQGLPGDFRNPEAMEDKPDSLPCVLDTGNPCRYDGLLQLPWPRLLSHNTFAPRQPRQLPA